MPSHIESLPNELFEPILLGLSLLDISKLNQSSKPLNKSLDSYLVTRPTAVNKLMKWGCTNGEKWAIEKALSYGADVNFVQVGPVASSTICLAARRHHYETIRFLMGLGARLDPPGLHHRQRRALRERLFEAGNPKLLQLCLELGAKDQILDFQIRLDLTLLSCIQLGLDLDICQQWMDLGANPATLRGKLTDPQSPFCTAILSGSVPLTRLLLPPDANLGVPDDTTLFELPRYAYCDLHPWYSVPILAAARSMATHGNTDMMDTLLELGGDVNLNVTCGMGAFGLPEGIKPHAVNPLLAYVLSLDFDANLGGRKVSRAQGVKYLFDKGAKLENPKTDKDTMHPPLLPLIRLLWNKYDGVKCLLNADIFAVLKVLVENGGAKNAIYSFLLPTDRRWRGPWGNFVQKYETNKSPLPDEDYHLAMERWGALLDLILRDENFEAGMAEEIDDLFLAFLQRVMIVTLHPNTHIPDPYPANPWYEFIDESHPTTIQKLVLKGASLNGGPAEEYSPGGRPKCTNSKLLASLFDYCGLNKENKEFDWLYWRHSAEPTQITRQCSLAATLIKMGVRPLTRPPGPANYVPPGYSLNMCRQLRAAFRGEIAEEDRLLWNPRCGFLWDGSWRDA